MKFKRVIALTLAMLFAFSSFVSLSASAVTVDYYNYDILPGKTQSLTPDYSYSWISNLIVRSDINAVISTEIEPVCDYPYDTTYEQYVADVLNCSSLYEVDETTVARTYEEICELIFYVVVALGMTADYDTMTAYLVDECGVVMPENPDGTDQMHVAVLYAALKYNAFYVLYEQNVEIPEGTTLEGAIVIILATFTAVEMPEDVDTIEGFAVAGTKRYVQTYEEIPISDDPSNEEIFFWTKVITVSSAGYDVPLYPYDELTGAQKEYVDYAYFATILNVTYDVEVNPILVAAAYESEDELAFETLILTSMLDSVEAEYDDDSSCEDLFYLACENGFFELDQDFYSDIFEYNVVVASDCEELWFTPVAIAAELTDGNNDNAMILFGDDTSATSGQTVSIALDPTLEEQTITMGGYYIDDELGIYEKTIYTFNITRNDEVLAQSQIDQSDIVGSIEGYISNMLPSSSETADTILGAVMDSVEAVLDGDVESEDVINILTTFGVGVTDSDDVYSYSGYDFVDEAFDYTYDVEEVVASTTVSYSVEATTTQTFVEQATEAVSENPEIVIAPTSLVMIGGLAGYFFNKKRKDLEMIEELERDETTQTTEEEKDISSWFEE